MILLAKSQSNDSNSDEIFSDRNKTQITGEKETDNAEPLCNLQIISRKHANFKRKTNNNELKRTKSCARPKNL